MAASNTFEIVEGLTAGIAAIERFAGRRTKFTDKRGIGARTARAAHLSGNVGMAAMADRRADAIFTQAPAGIVVHPVGGPGGLQLQHNMYRAKAVFGQGFADRPQQMLRCRTARIGWREADDPAFPCAFTLRTMPKSVMVSTGTSGSGIWLNSAQICGICAGAMSTRRCMASSITTAGRGKRAGDTASLPASARGVQYVAPSCRPCDTPPLRARGGWLPPGQQTLRAPTGPAGRADQPPRRHQLAPARRRRRRTVQP